MHGRHDIKLEERDYKFTVAPFAARTKGMGTAALNADPLPGATPSTMMLAVVIPPGMQAGQTFVAESQDGTVLQVVVPASCVPGQQLYIQSPMLAEVMQRI